MRGWVDVERLTFTICFYGECVLDDLLREREKNTVLESLLKI